MADDQPYQFMEPVKLGMLADEAQEEGRAMRRSKEKVPAAEKSDKEKVAAARKSDTKDIDDTNKGEALPSSETQLKDDVSDDDDFLVDYVEPIAAPGLPHLPDLHFVDKYCMYRHLRINVYLICEACNMILHTCALCSKRSVLEYENCELSIRSF